MIKNEIYEIIKKSAGDTYQNIKIPDFTVEYPKQKEHGDYASNIAMVLAKSLSRAPMEIAEELAVKIRENEKSRELFENITAANPGFINIQISRSCLLKNLEEILSKKDRFGSSDFGKGKTIVIDYSAPNVAKPMHVGHMRSAIIGQSLYNIYKFLGYRAIGDNHIGDWGTQFGKLIYAYKNWGAKKIVNEDPIEEMTKLYVRFHKEAEINPELEEYARNETKKLQNKDPENLKIWKFLVRESLKDYGKLYKILGIKFDYVLNESFYDSMLPGVVKESLDRKIAEESQGAIIINLEKQGLPPFLIRKTDGAYLYTTTDLATAKYRKEKFKADKILYVVANEQALHFRQLFASLEILGWTGKAELEHIKFGMVLGDNGKKLATRKGEVIRLEDLIKKAIEISKKVVEEKSPNLSMKQKKKIAKVVGIGAIKYNDLSQNRMTDITFNWDRMLSFEGNSGPYLQYVYARINSLEDKYNNIYKIDRFNLFDKPAFDLLTEGIEKEIMRKLINFPEAVENSAKENAPHLIALYLYELASLYNNFYNSLPILKSEKKMAKARIALSRSVAVVVKNGLNMLGIEVLERI